MLTRLFVDNYRCFERFTFEPKPLQLVLGANGTGKSSMFDVLRFVSVAAIEGRPVNELFDQSTRPRWSSSPFGKQVVELDVSLNGRAYSYHLTFNAFGPSVQVASERLSVDTRPLLSIDKGTVQLFDDHGQETNSYLQSPDRCLLGLVEQIPPNTRLGEFRDWLANLYVLNVDPTEMKSVTSKEERRPSYSMSNYASWYRYLLQIEPRQIGDLLRRVEAILPGFHSLRLEDIGQNAKLLKAEFKRVADEAHECARAMTSANSQTVSGRWSQFTPCLSARSQLDEPSA